MTLLDKHRDNPESEGAMVAVAYLLSLIVPMYVECASHMCVEGASIMYVELC